MENYKYLGFRKKHSSKSNKDYFLAYLLLENSNGYDVLNVIITEKQANALSNAVNDIKFDISKFLTIQYNSFNKSYDLKITYGL